jgi:trehalose-phosphatase
LKDLLESWDTFIHEISGKELLLFLDYDGTLSPIAPTPAEATLPDENKDLLARLVKMPFFQTVIISGRPLHDLKNIVGLKGPVYIGNHGWEIEDASMHLESLIPTEVTSVMKKIKYELITQLSDIPGAFVEDKGVTLSVHYRLSPLDKEPLIRRIFDYICMPYRRQNMVKVYAGKKVLELRPPLAWDKGKAALWLLRKHAILRGSGRVWPVYIGDDVADEDAFEALKARGTTVWVGDPKIFSAAKYFLTGTREVTEVLRRIIEGALVNA